jgi:phosphoribosylformylglycinamidine cyclo-ligase
MVIALDESEASKAIDILAKYGDKASVIGKVTDKKGVNIVLK